MMTVMTHNNGYDSILLVDGAGEVASAWSPATKQDVEAYVRDGSQADLWDDQGGVEIDGRAARAEDYGDEIGSNGGITDERRDFWLR